MYSYLFLRKHKIMLGYGIESFKSFSMNVEKQSKSLIEKIKAIKDVDVYKGCTAQQIADAEKKLKLTFPKEYVDYVKEFGHISFGGVEWTGLNTKSYLNVVDATLKERKINKDFPDKHFVLEDFNIDCKIIIVNEASEVFLFQLNKKSPVANSISAYLDLCLANAY